MGKRNIIVIGTSAGGFDALKTLAAALPAGMNASIFIVWHMSAGLNGILPTVLNRSGPLPAHNALNKEKILPGHIYVAPPDHHLLVEKDTVRVTHGPRENRFRPAVDPLFRSAAVAYGTRVIGIVLSGALDDGTSGLWTIKAYGGIAIVQDPRDADVPAMPENALKTVAVDYTLPLDKIAPLLVQLVQEEAPDTEAQLAASGDEGCIRKEIAIAKEDNVPHHTLGEPSVYACPECHGVLSALMEGGRIRFRCHTGHAYAANSLLTALTDKVENSLWNTVRGIEEAIYLLNHMGDHFAENNQPRLAAKYFQKAKKSGEQIKLARKALTLQEKLATALQQATKE